MKCPFLKEAQVKYCRTSPFRKMILRAPEHGTPERCSSPEYIHCPSTKRHPEEPADPARCPSLQESLVQYCSAASVTKFIPYTESILSRCGNESHRYCDLFLALANPAAAGVVPDPCVPKTLEGALSEEQMTKGIRVPLGLSYSSNHMWLDINQDGCCHVGVDAFLARVLGSVEKLTFLAVKGVTRPAAVFTVKGADLQMVFPNPILLVRSNSYLRADPGKLISDPYGVGWLFEGEPATENPEDRTDLTSGLIPGKSASVWMREEFDRLAGFIHEQLARTQLQGASLMADGGSFAPGFVRHLSREEILNLFNAFFSPYATGRRQS